MSKSYDEFMNRHRIKILDTNKRALMAQKMNVDYFKFDDDYNKFKSLYQTVDTESLYTVEITKSELDRIAEFESQVFNNMAQTGHYRMFETLMEQKEREARLRDKYPAVKKAYQQYSMILKLAESGEL